MRRTLVDAAIDTMLPPIKMEQSALARVTQEEQRGPVSKTTIVAFRYADGIMCAADRKTSSYGYGIFSQRSQKIYQVSPMSFLLGCGSVGSIQEVSDQLKARCMSVLRAYGIPLSIQGQAKYTARLCNHIRRFLDGWDFSFGGILAGSSYDGSSHIYSIDEDGSRLDCPDYTASGSGGDNATMALDILWKRAGGHSMSMERALQLAVEVMYRAADRDSGSSALQVIHPTVAVITGGVGMFLGDDLVSSFSKLFLYGLENGDATGDWLTVDLLTDKPREKRSRKK